MPIMCATIYAKGHVMRSFDAYFAGNDVPYQKLIDELSNPNTGFTTVFKEHGVISAADARHINQHWLADKPPGYWPLHRGKENIIKQAAIRAMKCAMDDGRPIVTSWICTGGQFQVIVEQCPAQVNLLIATPPPPILTEEATVEETIWISGSPDAIAMVRLPYVEDWNGSKTPAPEYEATPFSDVAEIQMKGT